ncbi:pro-neuregulin-3, membrane-bound isoform-like [Hyaena hyaena]|nr:pro-neuregulin-3, membrane-bound isoform-like [Hyaena hyaena]
MRRPGLNGKVPLRGARCRFQECIGSVPGGQRRKGGCVGSLGGHGVDKGEVVNLKSFPREQQHHNHLETFKKLQMFCPQFIPAKSVTLGEKEQKCLLRKAPTNSEVQDESGLRCTLLTSILILFFKFTESEEVYQRQVLSISCIIFGIVIVGMFCAAFYFKSKKQAKQIQEQLKEPQNGKNYSLKASSTMAKSENLVKNHVQLQSYSKAERHPVTALEKMMESSFAGPQSFPEVPSPDRGSQSVKHHSRSLSSCCSPGQRSGMLHRNAFRRTPPSPRSRLGGIVGPAYQQLEESRIPDQDMIPCQGIEVRKTIPHLPIQLWCVERSLDFKYSSNGLKTQQNASINMQLPSRETNSYFNSLDQKDLMGYSSTRASSVPIIPSVGLEETCMQMPGISEVKSIKWCKNSYSADIVNVSIPVSDCLIAEQQEVKILLETVQEQIRILTDARRSEDYELASVETEDSASENTAFLPLSPTAKSEREAQFVLRNEIQRDSALTK